jgi:hypothetical protein
MLAHAGPEPRTPRPLGRPPHVEAHVARLEVSSSKHWPVPSETQLRCRVCKTWDVTQKVFVKCRKCQVGLCQKVVFRTLPHQGTVLITSSATCTRITGDYSQYVSKRNIHFCKVHTFCYLFTKKLLLLS